MKVTVGSDPQKKRYDPLITNIDRRDLVVWRQRWQALEETLDELETRVINLGADKLDRSATLLNLLRCLREFGSRQFNFFYEGFSEQDTAVVRLEASLVYPPQYVLRRTLDQVGFDISVIRRVIDQRSDGLNLNALKTADCLAYQALKPAMDADILAPTTVLTYFQKEPSVRIIPYAPVVLIGIPYTSAKTSRDFLAIAHEVGHYVYRYGVWREKRLFVSLRDVVGIEPEWLNSWLEEIFADVYGCLIAGPVMAQNFLELQLDSTLDEFTADDGKHPAPVIRPLIYKQVLDKLKYKKTAEALQAHWQDWLALKNNPDGFIPQGSNKENRVKVYAAQRRLKSVVNTIVDALDGENITRWTGDLPREAEKQKDDLNGEPFARPLYAAFEAFVKGIEENCPDKAPELEEAGESKVQLGDRPETSWHIGKSESWIDALIDLADQKAPVEGEAAQTQAQSKHARIPSEVWSLIFIMMGWTIGGAETQGHPK